MRTHRFGRKLKLPSTIAIKHQIRMLMVEDALKLKNVEAPGAEAGVGRELTGKAPPIALARNDSTGVRKVRRELYLPIRTIGPPFVGVFSLSIAVLLAISPHLFTCSIRTFACD